MCKANDLVLQCLLCLHMQCLISSAVQVILTQGDMCRYAQKGWLTEKSLVIICSVTWKTASKIFGTSFCIRSLSLLMMAAKRLSTSASLHTNTRLDAIAFPGSDNTSQACVSLSVKNAENHTGYASPV